ncbi:MAG: hypothetical protein FJY82_14635 [Candidatus Aminicenantes bacterium]|nr:hypothetical protein [Candidatus Aminicenantes bacterium]
MRKGWSVVIGLWLIVWAGGSASARQEGRPTKNEISQAEFYLKKMEQHVQRLRGQSIKLTYDDNEALRRVKALKEKYPRDPQVEELFQRAQKALMATKGDFIEITPEMTAYRQIERKLNDLFYEETRKAWEPFLAQVTAEAGTILKAYPAESPRDRSLAEMVGRTVVLEDFQYPTNAFTAKGQEYVFCGSGTKGYYYVDIGGREWLGPYEAVKRYRRQVNGDIPEGGPWTLVGKITGSELLVPQAEKEKTVGAFWGWTVLPVAVYVPGRTFARFDPAAETGGRFAGEEKAEAIKGKFYTQTTVPDDIGPEDLVLLFATAIKEKNLPLFLACIDPERQKTPRARSRIMYHWDLHQERFARFYVHVTVEPAKVETIKGFAATGYDDFFLTEAQKAQVRKISESLVEEAVVWSKAWDERGRQYGSPKPHEVRRKETGRWYITDYAAQF